MGESISPRCFVVNHAPTKQHKDCAHCQKQTQLIEPGGKPQTGIDGGQLPKQYTPPTNAQLGPPGASSARANDPSIIAPQRQPIPSVDVNEQKKRNILQPFYKTSVVCSAPCAAIRPP